MAFQDFTTYTEVDPGADITVTTNRVSAVGLVKSSSSWVYKDFGVDYFFNFVHEFKTQCFSSSNFGIASCWAVGNTIGGIKSWIDTYNGLLVDWSAAGATCTLHLRDADDNETDTKTGLSNDVDYYITVERDGVNVTADVRTGSHTGTLVDTLSVTTDASRKYRYIYGIQNWDDTNNSPYIGQRTDDLELPPPPVPRSYGMILM